MDEARLLGAALSNGEEHAHSQGGTRLAIENLDGELGRADARSPLCDGGGKPGRRHHAGRLVDEVSRAGYGPGGGPGAREGRVGGMLLDRLRDEQRERLDARHASALIGEVFRKPVASEPGPLGGSSRGFGISPVGGPRQCDPCGPERAGEADTDAGGGAQLAQGGRRRFPEADQRQATGPNAGRVQGQRLAGLGAEPLVRNGASEQTAQAPVEVTDEVPVEVRFRAGHDRGDSASMLAGATLVVVIASMGGSGGRRPCSPRCRPTGGGGLQGRGLRRGFQVAAVDTEAAATVA